MVLDRDPVAKGAGGFMDDDLKNELNSDRQLVIKLGGAPKFLRYLGAPSNHHSTESSYINILDHAARGYEQEHLSLVDLARLEYLINSERRWGGPQWAEKNLGRPALLGPEWEKEIKLERNRKINGLHREYYLKRGKTVWSDNANAIHGKLIAHDLDAPINDQDEPLIREIVLLCRGKIPGPDMLRQEIFGS